MEDKQPWATCLFTDILLSNLEETSGSTRAIDYDQLFKGIEGFGDIIQRLCFAKSLGPIDES